MLIFSEKAFWNCPFSISAFSVGSECKVPSDLRGGNQYYRKWCTQAPEKPKSKQGSRTR
jgi:hypothetical protein